MVALVERVRTSCRALMDEADFVTIDERALRSRTEEYAAATSAALDRASLDRASLDRASFDRADVASGRRPAFDDDEALLVVALDAINFGSGYHDVVRKEPGLSGARSMAARLRAYVAASGPLDSDRLRAITTVDCSMIFGQELDGGALEELMIHFAVALNDLGSWLDDVGGSISTAIERADRSAVTFAESLLSMPYYRDADVVDLASGPIEVSLYKRAQITPADLERTCGPGLFDDLDQLTAFADNLVPHVLRVDGVLRLDAELEATINAGARLTPGSRPEVELRAGGVVVVERLAASTGLRAMDLDLMLWERGAGERYKSVPRHRARGVFY